MAEEVCVAAWRPCCDPTPPAFAFGAPARTTDVVCAPRPQDASKKALDAPGFESGAFESLENDFQEVRPVWWPRARVQPR